jgi:hypothetical protein
VGVVVFTETTINNKNVPYFSKQLFVRLQQHPADETQKEKEKKQEK